MQPPFLCFRADSGNFLVLVVQAVIFLPGSGAERTSRKAVEARRCWSAGLRAHGAAQGGDSPPRDSVPMGRRAGDPPLPHASCARHCRPCPWALPGCRATCLPLSLPQQWHLPPCREMTWEAGAAPGSTKSLFSIYDERKASRVFSSVRRNFLRKEVLLSAEVLACLPVRLGCHQTEAPWVRN